jgi:hypothetical protein
VALPLASVLLPGSAAFSRAEPRQPASQWPCVKNPHPSTSAVRICVRAGGELTVGPKATPLACQLGEAHALEARVQWLAAVEGEENEEWIWPVLVVIGKPPGLLVAFAAVHLQFDHQRVRWHRNDDVSPAFCLDVFFFHPSQRQLPGGRRPAEMPQHAG